MELKEYLDYLVIWLQDVLKETKAKGFIVGLSGGIDSALVAALIKRASDNVLGVIMPCHSNPADKEDAILVAEAVKIPYTEVNLAATYDTLMKEILKGKEIAADDKAGVLAANNTKVRLRMTTLYALGQMNGYLVVGTDNLAEWYTGYFTKYGDGGVDLVPIVHLTKGQVREASRMLGIPEKIVNRVPTAGLYSGQTDETEMGVTYDELDAYLLGGKIDDNKVKQIEHLHRISEHKRNLALKPKSIR
jgi:NAD+ synthase